MAGLSCDVCGGTIKMQANHIGICQKCGLEYSIESLRAMNSQSPTSLPKVPHTYSHPQLNSSEPDRNTILIHLSDLRVLETILFNLNRFKRENRDSIDRINERINKERQKLEDILKKEKDTLVYKASEENKCYPHYSGENAFIIIGLLMFLFSIGFLLLIGDLDFMLSKGTIIVSIIWLILVLVPTTISKIIKKNKYESQSTLIEIEFQPQLDMIKKEKEEQNDEIDKIEKRKEELQIKSRIEEKNIENEYRRVRAILDKAYSTNIIPLQFRTIEGIYYLYDYMSTSSQTFSEALMQANLEFIKQKLDRVIELQSIQIIQQAQTNAQLSQIQETNRQILYAAQQSAHNSELAAKYAAITAVNTEVLTILSRNQLAYIRADYWLK